MRLFDRRIRLAAAGLVIVVVFAVGFFVALGVRAVVAGPNADPVKPNPGHESSEIGLPVGTWSGLDADTVDGMDASELLAGPDGDWDYTTFAPDMVSIPGGNVGIGTEYAPQKLLDIRPPAGGYTDLGIRLSPLNAGFIGGTAWDIDNDDGVFEIVEHAGCAPEFVDNPLIVAVGNCIGSPYHGNVGIGTTNPQKALEITKPAYEHLGIALSTDLAGGTSWDIDNDEGVLTIVEHAFCAPEFVDNPEIGVVGNCLGSPFGGKLVMTSPDGKCHACGPDNSSVWTCSLMPSCPW